MSVTDIAAGMQTGKYTPDAWSETTLPAGERVWGGDPHQTAFYTSWASLAEFMQPGFASALWDALQVAPHGVPGTFRGAVAEYELISSCTVAVGKTQANGGFGMGGAEQYVIPDFKNVLRATGRVIKFEDADARGYAAAIDAGVSPW